MAAAFLLEKGFRTSSAEFTREVEEEGIKFNMDNATEDIINGLFCTYEPPTSKMEQYKAAKAVRSNPEKFSFRPSVPKSILKWKVKKQKKKAAFPPESRAEDAVSAAAAEPPASEARDDTNDGEIIVLTPSSKKKNVTWKDEKAKGDRTDIENQVVGFAQKFCGGACNQGEDIAEILSSPTGRAAQNFFVGGPETPGSMASMASGSMASMASSVFGSKMGQTPTNDDSNSITKRVLYDDLGNPIREDDVDDDDNESYFPSTPKDAAQTPSASQLNSSSSKAKHDGHQNLFCSNLPFMDTVKEGVGIAAIMAASAAAAAGVPENLCISYKGGNGNRTNEQEIIARELIEAKDAESIGVYEPESYDQPANSATKLKRQSTPKHMPNNTEVAEDEEETQQQPDDATAKEEQTNNVPSSDRSYATSDITMGNTTIKHFSGNASLFDDTVGAESPAAKSTKSYSSLVEELKHVQKQKGLTPQNDTSSKDGKSSVGSIKRDYEKNLKSPKSSVVTNSYMQSLKKTPTSNRESVSELRETSAGKVASLAKKFNRNGVRKSIDPAECRNFDGKVNFLPPTPRRNEKPETPTGYSMVGGRLEAHDWDSKFLKTMTRQDKEEGIKSPVSVNTDAEIREEASTILDVGVPTKKPTFAGRRPKSLVKGPETIAKDEDEGESKKIVDPPEGSQGGSDKSSQRKKSKKKKNKGFATKFKKALTNATKKVESQRITPGPGQGKF